MIEDEVAALPKGSMHPPALLPASVPPSCLALLPQPYPLRPPTDPSLKPSSPFHFTCRMPCTSYLAAHC